MGDLFSEFCAGPAFGFNLVEQYLLFVGDSGDQVLFSLVAPLKVLLGLAQLRPQVVALAFQFLVAFAELDEVALHLLVLLLVVGHLPLGLFGVTYRWVAIYCKFYPAMVFS